jgi:hypothetical protein
MKSCFECSIRLQRLDYDRDEVTINVGREKGFQVIATLRRGLLKVRREKLDPREPLDTETCRALYDRLRNCSGPTASAKPANASERAAMRSFLRSGNAEHFFFYGVENDYPGFSYNRFVDICLQSARAGKVQDISIFSKNFCGRHRSRH